MLHKTTKKSKKNGNSQMPGRCVNIALRCRGKTTQFISIYFNVTLKNGEREKKR